MLVLEICFMLRSPIVYACFGMSQLYFSALRTFLNFNSDFFHLNYHKYRAKENKLQIIK